jgi:peptidoglycan/xylan/chitin deacetylase (PgdA/CDA1 family)
MHVWHSVGAADARRLQCFNQRDLAEGVSSHCELPVFQDQIASIRRDFRVVSFAEALALLEPGRRGFGWCAVLTFDDGFANTVATALPWLHAQGLPSTLFVNADLASRIRIKDVDLVIFAINALGPRSVAKVLRSAGTPAHELSLMSRQPDLRTIVAHDAWPAGRQALLDALGTTEAHFAEELGIYANWDQLRLVPPSVTIGNHGAAHAFLPSLSDEELEREITGGLETVQRELAVTDMPYAFAFGGPQDLSPESDRLARKRHTAVVTAFGGVNLPGSAPTALHRVPMFSTADDRLRAEYEFPPRTLLSLARF